MKRLVQYLILAAVLVGLPLGCAWLAGKDEILSGVAAFPPRTEDWGAAEYWQQRCPFNWTVFAALAVVVATVVGAFARKAVGNRALASARDARRVGYAFPWWGWLGLVMFLGWLPVSAAFWWFFEFLNCFSRNWYFVNLEDFTAFEYIVCFSLGCATILPSVLTTARWLGTFRCFSDRACEGMWKVDVDSRLSRLVMALLLRGNAAYRLRGLPAVRHRGASGLRMAGMGR